MHALLSCLCVWVSSRTEVDTADIIQQVDALFEGQLDPSINIVLVGQETWTSANPWGAITNVDSVLAEFYTWQSNSTNTQVPICVPSPRTRPCVVGGGVLLCALYMSQSRLICLIYIMLICHSSVGMNACLSFFYFNMH